MGFLKQAAAPLAAGINILGSALQSKYQKKRDERQFSHNRQMAEYAYGKDLEQWERANLYNAPTQQMARLRAAGLNPAMMYGSSGHTTAAATLPKYQQVKADYQYESPLQLQGALSAFQQMGMQKAQIKNIEANTRLTDEKWATEIHNGLLRNHQSLNEKAKSAMSQQMSQYFSEFTESKIKQINQQILESEAAIKAKNAQTSEVLQRTKFDKNLRELERSMGMLNMPLQFLRLFMK